MARVQSGRHASAVVRRLQDLTGTLGARPVALVFCVALAVRLTVAITISLTKGGTLFPDDAGYIRMVLQFVSGETQSWAGTSTWGLWNLNASFLLPIGMLFILVGPHIILGQMFSAVAGSIAAAAVAWIVRRNASTKAAVFSGLVVALFPSQVLWSSLVLKDSFSWAALSLIAVTLAWWDRKFGHSGFIKGSLLLFGLTFFLSHLRLHTLVVACIAATITLLLTARTQRLARIGVVVLLGSLLPLIVNAAFFSDSVVVSVAGGLSDLRGSGAQNARTALVVEEPSRSDEGVLITEVTGASPEIPVAELLREYDGRTLLEPCGEPSVPVVDGTTYLGILSLARLSRMNPDWQNKTSVRSLVEAETISVWSPCTAPTPTFDEQLTTTADEQLTTTADEQLTTEVDKQLTTTVDEQLTTEVDLRALIAISTEGEFVGVVRAPREDEDSSELSPSLLADLAYLPTGLRVMLLDPLPQHLSKSPKMAYAFLEHLVWYPLLVLALFGLIGRRKNLTPELTYALLVTGGLALMWGLIEGNFGTAFRHRGELVWGVVVFAGLGVDRLLQRLQPLNQLSPKAPQTQDG